MFKSIRILLLFMVVIFVGIPEVTYQKDTLASSNNTTTNASVKTSGNMSKADPSDLVGTSGSLLVTDIAAQELSSATPSEIAVYPLNDYSADDILLILSALSRPDLEKVLTNIPLDVLQRIYSEASEDKITELLADIPQNSLQKIEQRLQS